MTSLPCSHNNRHLYSAMVAAPRDPGPAGSGCSWLGQAFPLVVVEWEERRGAQIQHPLL